MGSKAPIDTKTQDGLLKSMLVFSRTVDYVLESQAVSTALNRHLSSSKVQILRLLGLRGSKTATQVAHFLGVSRPAVTQLIDSMVRTRMVVRRTAKSDRRESNLQLTKLGVTAFQAVRRQQRHFIRAAARDMQSKDAKKWITLLEGMSAAVAKADRAFKNYCLQCGAHEDGSCVLVGGDCDCLFLQHQRKAAGGKAKGKAKENSKSTAKKTAKRKSRAGRRS
jgi:DNA-binding MarR family transcriptional regulator